MKRLPKMLVICPEAIVPPCHGGSLRSASLLNRMSKRFEVFALVPQTVLDIESGLAADPECRNVNWISVPDYPCKSIRQKLRAKFEHFIERVEKWKWKGIYRDWFFGNLHSWKPLVLDCLNTIGPDVVMIEHARHAAILDYVRKLYPRALRVVNSHNVESSLLRQVMSNAWDQAARERIIKSIESYERKLNERCQLLLCCSTEEMQKYYQIGVLEPQIEVVPNGVDSSKILFRKRSGETDSRPTIIFSGTLSYEPNVDGIRWFHEEIWPNLKKRIPELRLLLVGKAPCDYISGLADLDSNIELFANVPSMNPFLQAADVSICPLLSGSGTRLKILEAFSAGLPTVSTSIGAEGIDYSTNKDILIADSPDSFVDAVVLVLENKKIAEELGKCCRQLVVSHYDWEIIAKRASEILESAITKTVVSRK